MQTTEVNFEFDHRSFANVEHTLDKLRLESNDCDTVTSSTEDTSTGMMNKKKTHRRKRAGEKTQRRRVLHHWKAWQVNDNLADEVWLYSQQMLNSPERPHEAGDDKIESNNNVISPVHALRLNLMSEEGSGEITAHENNAEQKKRSNSRRRRHGNRPYVVLRPRTIPAPHHPSQFDTSYSSEESDGMSYYSSWDVNQDYNESDNVIDENNNLWEQWPVQNDSRIPHAWSELPEESEDDKHQSDYEQSLAKLPNSELIQRINTMSNLFTERSTTHHKENSSTLQEELQKLREENMQLKADNQILKQNIVYSV